MNHSPSLLLPLVLLATTTPGLAQLGGASGVTELVSTTSTGAQLGSGSSRPSISTDGRYVAFSTVAALDPADNNGVEDIYVKDRWTGSVTCASKTQAGGFGNDSSVSPDISADGRWVVFATYASDLVSLDVNLNETDILLKDLQTGSLERINNALGTAQSSATSAYFASVSDDGNRVAFRSASSDLVEPIAGSQVFLYDRPTDTMHLLSKGLSGSANGVASYPKISGDGLRVVFNSNASNLVLGDWNGQADVFVAELGQSLKLLSRNTVGLPANGSSSRATVSTDGAYVAFQSSAPDLVVGDANGTITDAFVVEVDTGHIELASINSSGLQVFSSITEPLIAPGGRAVAFTSQAEFAGHGSPHNDTYLRDLDADRVWTVTRPTGIAEIADGFSFSIDLAGDGSTAAFQSYATNMVPGDTNNMADIFVRQMHPDPVGYCTSSTTKFGCQPNAFPKGWPSATGATDFHIYADDVPNKRWGILFYSFGGRTATPFAGATMCIRGKKRRTPVTNSGGSAAAVNDCTGVFALEMNDFAAGLAGGSPHAKLGLVGQRVNAQFWGRAPGSANGSFLSSAVEYVVGP